MIKGIIGRVAVGDMQPVRSMGVINLSRESFYKGSVACPDDALSKALAMQSEGADLIDLVCRLLLEKKTTVDEAE